MSANSRLAALPALFLFGHLLYAPIKAAKY
jgi:hypothetical protein